MNRNDPCPCGSGKRYKHCHGSVAQDTARPSSSDRGAQDVATGQRTAPGGLQSETLAAYRAGELRRAEALYRRLIAERPDDVEARQMLAAVLFERLHYGEALAVLWDAAERDAWRNPVYRTNVGFALAKLLSRQANARQQDLVARYLARERSRKEEPPVRGRISVVLVAGGDAGMIERSIDSVAAQTYRDLELVIAGDALVEPVLSKLNERVAGLPFSATVLASADSSRSATASANGAGEEANAGARAARGDYLAFLEAGDCFAADRIETMISEIARATPMWGFSQVEYRSAVEHADRKNGSREARRPLEQASGTWDSAADQFASFALRRDDIAGASGNLFVQRDLFLALGGYRDVDRHGWDFCIRAARVVEPVFIERPLYFADPANRPGAQTLHEAESQRALERRRKEIVADALTDDRSATNEFCPQFAGNRLLLLQAELHAGRGDRIPIALLRSVAAEWRDRIAAQAQPGAVQNRAAPGKASTDKVALVVLGVYRSGTSALARVLNLCGAALPENVIGARLDINRKGFWETEAVVDLNARMLQRVGAGWNGIDVALPPGGPVVDEFIVTAREILESEYKDEPLILIKDPRMCVLAPIWHRALRQSGYRPAYVVAVRDPREVAGSLGRSLGPYGGMPRDQALALWHSYTKAAEAFVDRTDAKVVFVHYGDLLDDWRGVMRTIARQLEVALDTEVHADAIDSFLDPSLRSQRVEGADSDTSIAPLPGAAMEALYRRILERCALSLRPGYADAQNNLANVLRERGRAAEAVEIYRNVLKTRDVPEAWCNLARALTDVGAFDDAVRAYAEAIVRKETSGAIAGFVQTLVAADLRHVDDAVRRMALRALTTPWARPSELSAACIRVLASGAPLRECIDRAWSAWPARLSLAQLLSSAHPDVFFDDVLLRSLLESAPVCDPVMERFLTLARFALLDAVDDRRDNRTDPLRFGCALARQCFINDYVFAVTDSELERARGLRDDVVAALSRRETVAPMNVAVVAAYFPLLSLPKAESLLSHAWPEPLDALLTQQLREPAEERAIRDDLRRLTDIDDRVSKAVRAQYEEHPYPRWVKLPPASLAADDPAGRALWSRRERDASLDILVAGCGTGQESIEFAHAFPNARVLAVDLSLASLAYAERKARELQVANVEHAQADLTRLGALARRFDLISSVGVLHHLGDPQQGLAVLAGLLAPGGDLLIGLYSERARDDVVAARAFIAERGYRPTGDDIRRCRQDLVSDAPALAARIARRSDFFVTGECRDLLFHVQEHRFTLSQIGHALDAAGLVFDGFLLRPELATRYASQFPDDRAMTSLANWDRFETAVPHAFAGMYIFRARKPREAAQQAGDRRG